MSQVTSERGIALVIVLSITGILAIFGIVLLRTSSIQYQQTEQSKAKERALFYAEAGIEEARWYILERGTNWLKSKADSTDNLFHLGFDHAMDSTHGNVRVDVKNIDDIAGQDLYTISSVGTYFIGGKNIQRKIVATAAAVKQSSMSDIFLFIGDGNQHVGDSYNAFGPVHINGRMIFDGTGAQFHDRVAVTESYRKYNWNGETLTAGDTGTVVTGGWGVFDDANGDGTVDVPPLDNQPPVNPTASDFNQSRYKAILGGIHSTGDLIIEFFEEDLPGLGGYVIANGGKTYLNDLSQKTIYSDADCYVKGILQGQATVAASNNIYIQGNILYSQIEPPSNEPHIMGLMAKNNIVIPFNVNQALDFMNEQGQGTPTSPQPDTIPGDLIISAALYAGNWVFFLPLLPKGTLVINGSLASKFGVYFKLDLGTNYLGFKKSRYNYDNNFELFSPPNFISYSPPCIWNWHEEGI